MKTILILGANSTIANNCINELSWEKPSKFILYGRDISKFKNIEPNLINNKNIKEIQYIEHDVTDLSHMESSLSKLFCNQKIHIILFCHGIKSSQYFYTNSSSENYKCLNTNGLTTCILIEHCYNLLLLQGSGIIANLGSISTNLPHKNNYSYGSAKAMAEHYILGLAHRNANRKIRLINFKIGPVDTPMGENSLIKYKTNPANVARRIAYFIYKTQKKGNIYVPRYWFFAKFIIAIFKIMKLI